MADTLPEDLLVEILLRLPVKSVLRFRCVCRSWCSFIASSNFINAHLRHCNKRDDSLLLVRNYNTVEKKVIYALCHDNETLDEIMRIDFPVTSQNQFYRILGCVNGLVCLIDDIGRGTDHMLLWNPLLRRSIHIPKPNIAPDQLLHKTPVYGFGCGRFTDDCKILRILCPNEKSVINRSKPLIEIFRLGKGFWENLDLSVSFTQLDSRQAYLNGAIHWLSYRNLIAAFDVDTEVFTDIKLPNDLQNSSLHCLIIAAWRKSLSVFEVHYPGDFCLWVKKEYNVEGSWSRLFTVKSFGVSRWIGSLRKNGQVLLVENGYQLVSYDPETNQITDSAIKQPGAFRVFHMKPYTESLVLLDRVDAGPVVVME
ncbi:hypothetical protein Nepgr_008983 [Nepenthes gracilis]|uniref:F-box domain-containing protein n=1 Tax=Nepenthes gracilis TaxID=150966 RepID=A0AAD3S9L3_NEPGR|nr:hypothetical protein Nepgr_008983 [Nepenthes gracilis]